MTGVLQASGIASSTAQFLRESRTLALRAALDALALPGVVARRAAVLSVSAVHLAGEGLGRALILSACGACAAGLVGRPVRAEDLSCAKLDSATVRGDAATNPRRISSGTRRGCPAGIHTGQTLGIVTPFVAGVGAVARILLTDGISVNGRYPLGRHFEESGTSPGLVDLTSLVAISSWRSRTTARLVGDAEHGASATIHLRPG